MTQFESDFYFPYNSHYFSHVINEKDETMHSHSFYEFSLILHGSILHKTSETATPERLQQNELLLIPPNNIHGYQRLPSTVCSHRDLLFRSSFFEGSCKSLSSRLFRFVCQEKKSYKILLKNDQIQTLNYYIDQLLPHSKLSSDDYNSMTQVLLNVLLSYFLSIEKTDKEENRPEWINNLVKAVERNSIFNTSWKTIYTDIPYTKEHISRTFKKEMGITLTQFINDHKIQYAAYLLVTTNLSLSEILNKINILSDSYFIKLFKKKYKLTPHQYRLAHSIL